MLTFMAMISEHVIPFKNTNQVTDDIILKIGEGDMEAFRFLYDCTQNAIFGYTLSYLKNPCDAEDAMQETYIRVRENAHRYKPNKKPMAWVFTIAKNLSLMKLRERVAVPLDEDILYCNGETERQMIDNVVLRMVLDTLDEECRQIVILHSITGLKFREIAVYLGLGLSTVLSKYNRAMKKLQKDLKEME